MAGRWHSVSCPADQPRAGVTEPSLTYLPGRDIRHVGRGKGCCFCGPGDHMLPVESRTVSGLIRIISGLIQYENPELTMHINRMTPY